MKRFLIVAALLAASLGSPVRADDGYAMLLDPEAFQRVQKDVLATGSIAELDALNDVLSTCSAVSLGQRQQHFECERDVRHFWTRYNRGRSIDGYVAAVGGLFEAFDNAGANPTEAMDAAYRRTSANLIALLRDINTRYGQLEKH